MNISIAIAVRDEEEAHRKKQGDIMAIKPEGWQWGNKEVKNHLILEVALPVQATMELAQCLTTLYFDNGIVFYDGENPNVIGKRRFNIDWSKLKIILQQASIDVDWNRVEDVEDAYQPLSIQVAAPGGEKTLIDPTKTVNDKYENRLIRASDFLSWVIGN